MEELLTFNLEADEIEIFLQDVNEHLQTMEAGILDMEQLEEDKRAADPETLNAVFRAAHTLKAVAGAVGHSPMAELTHTMETLFDAMREGELFPSQEMVDELLAAVDALGALRDEVVDQQPRGVDVEPMLERLRELMEVSPAGEEEAVSLPVGGTLMPEQTVQAGDYLEAGQAILEISVTADPEGVAPGARLLQASMGLAEEGQVIAQHPSEDDLLEDRHDGHLWVVLATQAETQVIEEILEDVDELAEFRVQPCALEEVAPPPPAGPPVPEEVIEGVPERPPEALEVPIPSLEIEKTVRISVERLDALMDLVGELVTDRTRLVQIEQMLRAQYGKGEDIIALNNTIAHVGQVVDQLQDEVMRARMLPISHLFNKFPRLVRDVARGAGKQVNLIIKGETTELDRSIIEAIGDPLIHLLRNAVSHGIETPEARVAAGKPSAGAVWLTAEHAEGQIIVTVRDDGRGINPDRARQVAVEQGTLSEEEAARLSDDEALTLIFRPGFSTADQVTGVSGRGVGLDVVRTNISRIGGSVVTESEAGRGTTFRLTLPLTLAIVQTMLVAVGADTYAIPLTSIIESLYLSDVIVHRLKGKPAIQWRDGVLPLLHLPEFFRVSQPAALERRLAKPAVIAVAWGKLQAGLVVDRIIGKQEIVVKPFGPIIGNLPGLSGCTILGDGRIALIVDVPGLINVTVQAGKQSITL